MEKGYRNCTPRARLGRRHASSVYGYTLESSPFGPVAFVWQETKDELKVIRIFLPGERDAVEAVRGEFPRAALGVRRAVRELGERVRAFLEGELVDFELNIVALEQCSGFQRKVLLAEYSIPRGWVSTYGKVGRCVGVERGARAVGRALANNPFPIVIPCHRTIRANGVLGGFQGGVRMKRALLEHEGIQFTHCGRAVMNKVFDFQ